MPARADAAPFALVWTAPEGCPSRQQIVEATQAKLGEMGSGASVKHARVAEAPELFVQGEVKEDGDGFVVTLALRDAVDRPMGERELRVAASRCDAVEEPTSLVLAMMIAVARPRIVPRAAFEDLKDSRSDGRSAAPIAPSLSPAPGHRSRLSFGLGGVASRGLFPVMGAGAMLRTAYTLASRFVIGVETTAELGGSIRVGGAEVDFSLLSASALAGARIFEREPLDLLLLLGARVGLFRTSTAGLSAPNSETHPTVLVGPGMLVRVRIGPRLFVETTPQLEAILVRDAFELRSGDAQVPIHRPSLVEGRLSLGLSYEFR